MTTTKHPRLSRLANEALARARANLDAAALARHDAFSPDQERDENGRWSGGADVEASSAKSEGAHSAAMGRHSAHAKEARMRGRPKEAAAHKKAAEAHIAAAVTISKGVGGTSEASSAARKASAAAFAASRRGEKPTGANSPRVAEQVENAIQEQKQAKLQAMASSVAKLSAGTKAAIEAKNERTYGKPHAEALKEASVGAAYEREMESRRAAITGNVKPPSGNEPSREERRAAIVANSQRAHAESLKGLLPAGKERQTAAAVGQAITGARPSVTRDPSKPYGTTEETRANGGRSYKVQVQNKPEPLRYQGKSIREKEEQYQKDLTRMREKQAERNAKPEAERIAEYQKAWTDPNAGKDNHAQREARLALPGSRLGQPLSRVGGRLPGRKPFT